jgi:ankyrin repeat protein
MVAVLAQWGSMAAPLRSARRSWTFGARFGATTAAVLIASALASFAQTADEKREQAIKDKLAAPPLFLDEKHPGPTLVPKDLPKHIFPLDCRASQAYLHRVSPGTYHFQRAQYLLGQGPDSHWCDIFGLDRFERMSELARSEQGLREAEAALLSDIGLDQWMPESPRHVLNAAYKSLTDAVKKAPSETERIREVINDSRARMQAFRPTPGRNQANEMLARAAAAGDLGVTRKLIAGGADPNSAGAARRTPLMYASMFGHPDTVKVLIDAGASVNAVDIDHTTALRLAVVTGQTETTSFLLSQGADPEIRDEEGTTALMDASAMGLKGIVASLAERGANVNGVANDGSTPLLNAVAPFAGFQSSTRIPMLQFLLEHRADVNRSDWSGSTPLIVAAARNDFQAVQILLNAGAKPEARNADGSTPLLAAVKEDAVASAETLLKFGANANSADGKGNTPLLIAVEKGYPQGLALTRLLISHGADLEARNKGGATVLIAAAGFVYREPWGAASQGIFQELLSRGADANASNDRGTTPLMVSAGAWGHDSPVFLELLLNAHADINATDADGKTPLMAASERGHVEKVRFLLSHGAKADVRDKKGRTALDYAADYKSSSSSEHRPGCISSGWSNCAKTRDVLRKPEH